ncbi:MAG: hypothetical protein AB7F59_07485 [Bdellovibrionales bacterium]
MVKSPIIIHLQELTEDPRGLNDSLENLYLQGGLYELRFQADHLELLEKTFDSIISKHGVNDTRFTYSLNDSGEQDSKKKDL